MFNLFNKTPSVTVVEAGKKIKSPNVGFVDVRTPTEYGAGHASGAINIPLSDLEEKTDALRKFDEVYVICQSGGRSSRAVDYFITQGISAVNIEGGTGAWKRAELPME